MARARVRLPDSASHGARAPSHQVPGSSHCIAAGFRRRPPSRRPAIMTRMRAGPSHESVTVPAAAAGDGTVAPGAGSVMEVDHWPAPSQRPVPGLAGIIAPISSGPGRPGVPGEPEIPPVARARISMRRRPSPGPGRLIRRSERPRRGAANRSRRRPETPRVSRRPCGLRVLWRCLRLRVRRSPALSPPGPRLGTMPPAPRQSPSLGPPARSRRIRGRPARARMRDSPGDSDSAPPPIPHACTRPGPGPNRHCAGVTAPQAGGAGPGALLRLRLPPSLAASAQPTSRRPGGSFTGRPGGAPGGTLHLQ